VQIILDAVNVHTNGKKLPNILISGTPREEVMDLLVRANLPNTSAIQLQKILEKVLAISEKYGFRRVILVQRTHILTMVLKIASSGKSAYLEHLIRTVRSITEAGVVGSPAERIALTNKEKEVLNLLVAGFDRKEICENLAITLNTLKTHQKKLYEKLGVSSRDKAIDAAQKLGLIAG
jgi:LuxR family maltose regulon positive regulatory protein